MTQAVSKLIQIKKVENKILYQFVESRRVVRFNSHKPLLLWNILRERWPLEFSHGLDPVRTSGHEGGCMSGFMQPAADGIVPLPWL
jgi:hypothetical protein